MKKKILMLALGCFLAANLPAQSTKETSRQEVDFNQIHNSTVIFTFGQSNSANYGQQQYLYTAKHDVYNYFGGKLYKAQDPLLGATGPGASVWGILGDKLIEADLTKSVTIIPIGIGGVTVGSWSKGGRNHALLEKTLDEIVAKHIHIDCICWHQGESDNIANTSTCDYMEKFLTIREAFRSRGIEAPIVVAVASYHPYCLEEDHGCSKDIRKAQKQLAKDYKDIYPGPDTDKLDKCYQRADGIHFSHVGQQQHAALWVKAIRKIVKESAHATND